MPQTIDVDRGVTMRQVVRFDAKNPHKFEPDPQYGGMTVYMYKDEPGVYYDVHHKVVPEAVAAKAGFDTTKLAKARRKREAMAQFEEKLRAELAMEVEEEIILREGGGYKVIQLPEGRARIVDSDSNEAVTPVPMTKTEAIRLFGELTAGVKASSKSETAEQEE